MYICRPRLLLVAVVCMAALSMAGCNGDEEENSIAEVSKPDWWPSPPEPPESGGMRWPPPRSAEWQGAWPPDETAIDWWLEHFRRRHDPPGGIGDDRNPDAPQGSGGIGHDGFARAFKALNSPPDRPRPPCGYFTLTRHAERAEATCQPFPANNVKTLCDTARDEVQARATCEQSCAPQKVCNQGRLFTPALSVFWGCEDQAPEHDELYSSCTARFICHCGDS